MTGFKRNDAEHLTELVCRRNALAARRREVQEIIISTDGLADDVLRGCFEQMKAFDIEIADLNKRISAVQAVLLDF